jgi:hypothetical protein
MKILNALFLIAMISVANSLAQAKECFKDRLPYFRIIENIKGDHLQKLRSLEAGCGEFTEKPAMADAKSITGYGFSLAESVAYSAGGQAIGAFAKLNGSEFQKKFGKELEEIRRIEAPIDRIQKVYELVSRFQGRYDPDSGSSNTLSGLVIATSAAPNVLNNSEARGTGGVCRDFANLLHWSLQQVARAPSSKSQALGPNDFSSSFTTGFVPTSKDGWKRMGGHAWVRVHLPEHDGSGRLREFRNFDLDTTYFPGVFAPLFPRRSGVTAENRTRIEKECREIALCLYRIIQEAPQASEPEAVKAVEPTQRSVK